jgi:ribose transport system permease protein
MSISPEVTPDRGSREVEEMPDDHRRPSIRQFLSVDNVSLLFVWAVIIAFFGILRPEEFLSVETLQSILAGQAVTAIMALGLLLPVAGGKFDLSIAGTMGMSVVLAATIMSKLDQSVPVAIVLTLLGGVAIGAVNAFIVIVLRVNSFIATLGTGSILTASILWLSGGEPIVNGIPKSFTKLGQTAVLGVPLTVFYMLAIAAILWYVLERRQTGRYMYAIGSNSEAARLAGVRVNRLAAISLVASAVIATAAGIVFLMRIGAASTDTGSPYLLPAFAAVFLGATQFKAGRPNVLGTLVAVFVLATGVRGVTLLGAAFWVDGFFNGAALVIAVALAVRSGRQRSVL